MNEKIEFTEAAEEVELAASPEPKAFDRYADRRFTVGNLGSLAETMGEEEAEAFLDEFSLTRAARRGVIRRANERFRKHPY